MPRPCLLLCAIYQSLLTKTVWPSRPRNFLKILAPESQVAGQIYINNIGDTHITYKDLKRQRCVVRDFVDFDSWRNPVALNLTFKQCFWFEPYGRIYIDEIHASGCLNLLSNLINVKLLSRDERRQNDRLGFFAVIERGEYTRLHAHAMVECPDAERFDDLENLVATRWPKTIWGFKQTIIKPCDDGWLEYMMKFRTKADYFTAHDWTVMQLPKKKKS